MKSKKIICIVDDDPRSIQKRLSLFHSYGCIVVVAKTPDEIKRVFEQQQPDLLIVNNDMQGFGSHGPWSSLKSIVPENFPVVILYFTLDFTKQSEHQRYPIALSAQVDEHKLTRITANLLGISLRSSLSSQVVVTIVDEVVESFLGQTRDISETGMLLETDTLLSIGTTLKLSFALPEKKQTIMATGEVVRIVEAQDNQMNYGIEFNTADLQDGGQIRAYIDSLETDTR